MKGLRNELEVGRTLLANLCLREMIKYELNGISIISNFDNEKSLSYLLFCDEEFDMTVHEKIEGAHTGGGHLASFKEKFETPELVQAKSKFREFNKVAQKFIKQEKEDGNFFGPKPGPMNLGARPSEDSGWKNVSVASFIANVALGALKHNIVIFLVLSFK